MKKQQRISFILAVLLSLAMIFSFAGCGTTQSPKAGDPLAFNPKAYSEKTVDVNGKTVKYRAYEGIVYVAKPVAAAELDERNQPIPNTSTFAYQSMNIYVPESAISDQKAPILFRTYVGGYMPALPGAINKEIGNNKNLFGEEGPGRDFTGRALAEGYVVVSAGSRGSYNVAADDPNKYIGKAPAVIVDLKAAIRYLRHNDKVIPGDSEKIITDGWSAGGASSSILALSGNYAGFNSYLAEIGAANERDHIFAAIAFCPITDLANSDTAYEWLYNGVAATPGAVNGAKISWTDFPADLKALSGELKALYPAYIAGLNMTRVDTNRPLTADNYLDYIGFFLKRSAQKALDAGKKIPAETGIVVAGGKVTGIDINKYIAFTGRWSPIKNPPAFDNLGLTGNPDGSRENLLFGNESTRTLNYTDWSLSKASGGAKKAVDKSVKDRVDLMNAMFFVGAGKGADVANMFLRHGSFDRDTAFTVPINLYSKLTAAGVKVNFDFGWGYPHAGDYDIDEAFDWIKSLL